MMESYLSDDEYGVAFALSQGRDAFRGVERRREAGASNCRSGLSLSAA